MIPKATKDREIFLEDEVDDVKQRSIKGNLLISTTKGSNYIQTEEVILAKGSDAKLYALELVEQKYSVKIAESDVQEAHYLPGGNMLLRLWNTAPKSGFRLLIDRIKSGKGKPRCHCSSTFKTTF